MNLEHLLVPENEEVLKNKIHTHTMVGSKGHQSQMKEIPVVITGTI